MFARVSTLGGNHVKEVVKFLKETNPPGLEEMKGGYILAKENEKVLTITLWESREAVEASLPAAKKVLDEASRITGIAPKIEVYEVAMKI